MSETHKPGLKHGRRRIIKRSEHLETARDREVLFDLCCAMGPKRDGWVTPMWIGGTDGSHHSATLAKLARNGLAERRDRGGWMRPSYMYRATTLGHQLRSRK